MAEEILAHSGTPQPETTNRLQTAFDETQDAIEVLSADSLYPTAVTALTSAQNLIAQAQVTTNNNQRRALIQQAITTLANAKGIVATIAP